MKRFLTIEETADMLSVNYHTVYDMLERLGAIDLNQGRQTHYSAASLRIG